MGIGGGFFWLHFIALEIKLPSSTQPIVFYSNQKRDDLKLVICEALKKANSSILIHIYGLTDPDIIAILKEKKLRGAQITIF